MFFQLKVLEILQSTSSTDLFAPEIEEGQLKKTADPVTSDLLEALLSVRNQFFSMINLNLILVKCMAIKLLLFEYK